MQIDEKESKIVKVYSLIFRVLRWFSVYHIVHRFVPDKCEKTFVEVWVLGHLILSIILLRFWSLLSSSCCKELVVGYAIVRVFEIVIIQTNLLMFDWYRKAKEKKPYRIRGYLRILILLLHNYAEIVFWFAILYLNWSWAFANAGFSSDPLVALNYSFYTMTTFGHTDIIIANDVGYKMTLIQSVIGLFMVLLILARFISLIPTTWTSDKIEERLFKEQK